MARGGTEYRGQAHGVQDKRTGCIRDHKRCVFLSHIPPAKVSHPLYPQPTSQPTSLRNRLVRARYSSVGVLCASGKDGMMNPGQLTQIIRCSVA